MMRVCTHYVEDKVDIVFIHDELLNGFIYGLMSGCALDDLIKYLVLKWLIGNKHNVGCGPSVKI